MSFYLISSVLLEYISKMINGIQRWTKGLYSYRKICDDCFKEKQFITKYIRFLFHCTVCLSVMSSSHTSEEGENLLEYDSKKKSEVSFLLCLVIMSCSYSELKDAIQKFFSFLVLLQLHLLISWDEILTNMFVVSISKYPVTFISWKSSGKEW